MKRLSCGAVHVAPFDGPWTPSDCNPRRLNWALGSVAGTAPSGWANGVAAAGAAGAGDGIPDVGTRVPAGSDAGDASGEENGICGSPAIGPSASEPGGSTRAGSIASGRYRWLSGDGAARGAADGRPWPPDRCVRPPWWRRLIGRIGVGRPGESERRRCAASRSRSSCSDVEMGGPVGLTVTG
jgi:hypothetical protein